MNKRELSVRDEAIAASKETPEEFRARILLAAAVKLYEVGRVSSDVAARIAGISRSAFLTKLGDHRVDSVIDTRVSWSRLWLSRVPRKVWSGGTIDVGDHHGHCRDPTAHPEERYNETIDYGSRRLTLSSVKEEARRLIDELPDGATWDDVLYEFYVKKKIDRALEAADAGDVVSHEEAKRRILSK